jgi:hypothetical protein
MAAFDEMAGPEEPQETEETPIEAASEESQETEETPIEAAPEAAPAEESDE